MYYCIPLLNYICGYMFVLTLAVTIGFDSPADMMVTQVPEGTVAMVPVNISMCCEDTNVTVNVSDKKLNTR